MPREFPRLFWLKANLQGYGERWQLATTKIPARDGWGVGESFAEPEKPHVQFLEPEMRNHSYLAQTFDDEKKYPVVPAHPPHDVGTVGDLILLWRNDAPTPDDGVIAAVCEYYDATSRAFLYAEVHQGYVADGHRDLVSADINSDVLVATEEITRWMPLADYLRFCGCPHT